MMYTPLFLSTTPPSAQGAANVARNQPTRPKNQPSRKPDWLLLLISFLLLLTLLIAWLVDMPALLK